MPTWLEYAGARGYSLEVEEIIENERPPMLEVPTYREKFGKN